MNTALTDPLISCICITRNRPKQLLNAIADFSNQSYLNKELVVSYPKTDVSTKNLIEKILKISQFKIIWIEREKGKSLGEVKNEAIKSANGEYICIWDDDDCHHSNRLTHQMNGLKSNGEAHQASILTSVILYDQLIQVAYLSFVYNWSGSLLCQKKIITAHPYLATDRLEDIDLIRFLESEKLVYHIEDSCFLYIYVNHGKNALDYMHYKYFVRNSRKLPAELNENIIKKVAISAELS